MEVLSLRFLFNVIEKHFNKAGCVVLFVLIVKWLECMR